MEMKEFYYEDGLRVSLFNLDHESIPYHFHNEVSDMMYCARGQITIELPDAGETFNVDPGQVFQVPNPTKHRFVNGAPVGTLSRYVLLQIGAFDITFIPTDAQQPGLAEPGQELSPDVYIQDRRDDIIELADHFEREKPEVLSSEEQSDVVDALRGLAARGLATVHPRAGITT